MLYVNICCIIVGPCVLNSPYIRYEMEEPQCAVSGT